MEGFFFSPSFLTEFLWPKGQRSLKVGSVLPQNRRQILEGLQDLSSTSLRNRFMGSKKNFTEAELNYLSELDGYNHYAMGILESNLRERGIGIIRMVRSSTDPTEAEVALTIIDEYQRQGLGGFLLRLVMLAAWERGIRVLSFTFLRTNQAIELLIKKTAPTYPGARGRDFIQLYMKLEADQLRLVKERLAPILPAIENFPIET
jgi:GNAT superfamily N-acetyltransferase